MPPRIQLMQAARCCQAPIATAAAHPSRVQPSLVSLFNALSLQTRQASILANLRDNPGAYNKRIRKGRGPSSGYGKTSGRGHKGQKQHGKVKPWFQGGQTPLAVTWGRKGFENHRALVMNEVNLDRIQEWIDAGRLDATKQITPKEIIQSGLVGSVRDGIKLLARGASKLRTPIDVVASRASGAAIAAIEAAGGKVVTRYYTKQSIQRLLRGQSVHTTTPLPVGAEHVEAVLAEKRKQSRHMYRLPDPTSRWDIEYYRDPAHRGYLSHTLAPGESPSLYFKVPTERKVVTRSAEQVAKQKELADDRLF